MLTAAMGHPDDPQTITTLLGHAPATRSSDEAASAASLVVYARDRAFASVLVRGQHLVLGRVWPADLLVPDLSLSRQHARIERTSTGEIWIEDLESTNGTFVRGERISRARVSAADEIRCGTIELRIHEGRAAAGPLALRGHDAFTAAVDEEVARACAFERTFALLMIKPEGPAVPLAQWHDRIASLLRGVDPIGVYGNDILEICMVEASPDTARELTEAIARVTGKPRLRASMAVFPRDGRTTDALFETCLKRFAGRSRRATSEGDASLDSDEASGEIVPRSPAMRALLTTVTRVARTALPVLIVGETGSGKELIARRVHQESPRRTGPYCTVNCAAIAPSLLESTLFGHERGAFTGADRQHKGIFERAHGGTVFLDEVGELSATAQASLLRVLETKRLTRVGGTEEVEVDMRIVAATHRDLERMSQECVFRSDLFFRLNGIQLVVAPLRARIEEIEPLAREFLKNANKTHGTAVEGIDAAARAALERYAWPGNVRELRNVTERAAVIAQGRTITLQDLPEKIGRAPQPDATPSEVQNDDDDREVDLDGGDFRTRVQAFELRLILDGLKRARGNQSEAARVLGMPLRTLVHKIRAYGITRSYAKP